MTIITIKDYYLIIKLFDNEDYYLIIGNREDYTEGDRLCPPFRLYQKSGYHHPPFVKNYNLLVIEKETLFQLLATSRTHVPRYTIVENRPVLFPLAESSSMQRAPVVEGVVEAWTFTRAEKSETAGIAGNTWHWRIGPTSSHRKSQRKKERKRERERLVLAYSSTLRRDASLCARGGVGRSIVPVLIETEPPRAGRLTIA